MDELNTEAEGPAMDVESASSSGVARPVYGDLQITFLDVLQLTRHHENIIDNECSAISTLRQATREL